VHQIEAIKKQTAYSKLRTTPDCDI